MDIRNRERSVLTRIKEWGLSLVREVFCFLPPSLSLALGGIVGTFLRLILPKKRHIVRDNLVRSDLGLRENREFLALEKAIFRHFGRLGAEFLRLKILSDDQIARIMPLEGLAYFREEYEKGRGVILLTGHIGNWEYALRRIAMEAPGKVHPVIRRIKDPVVHSFVDIHRTIYGKGSSILADLGVKPLVRALSMGDVLIFVMDQNAGEGEGVFVPFFGRPACTYSSLARLSLMLGLPVIPAVSLRRADGSFKGIIQPPILPRKDLPFDEAIRRQTELYTRALEGFIREAPEQWIWMHRRWKTRPDGEGDR